jgi:hypothetical protein
MAIHMRRFSLFVFSLLLNIAIFCPADETSTGSGAIVSETAFGAMTKRQSYEGPVYSTDPFAAYTSRVFFYLEKLMSSSPDKVVFETVDPLFRATITYALENGRLKTSVETIPTQSGATTVGAFAFDAVTKDDCSYFLLPYYVQARRFPLKPLLMPSSVATMPLVLVESQRGGKPLSRGLS